MTDPEDGTNDLGKGTMIDLEIAGGHEKGPDIDPGREIEIDREKEIEGQENGIDLGRETVIGIEEQERGIERDPGIEREGLARGILIDPGTGIVGLEKGIVEGPRRGGIPESVILDGDLSEGVPERDAMRVSEGTLTKETRGIAVARSMIQTGNHLFCSCVLH